jgi:predicted HicB family RNase H-like nuclease
LKPLKIKISITIDEDIAENIRRKAKEDDRSLSQYVSMVLREHLAGERVPPARKK